MADPLADPRAQQLLSTDVGEIDDLAGFFQRVCTEAGDVASALRGAHADTTWTGPAADAFRAKLGQLPHDLGTVEQSYAEIAQALRTYAAHVEPIKQQFSTLAGQLGTDAQQLTSTKGGAHKHLQSSIDGLDTRGMQLLDEFDTVRGACRSAVAKAEGLAPRHHSSLFGSICHIADDVGHFVAGAVEGIGESVKNLCDGHDIIAFIDDPSWSTFGTLVKDVGVTASLVAMVAAPFAAPELAGADAAVDGGAEAADVVETAAETTAGAADTTEDVVDSVSTFTKVATRTSTYGVRTTTGSGVVSTGVDGAQGHWKDAGIDAAFIVAPNLGKMPGSIDDVKTVGDQGADALHIGERQAAAATKAAESAGDYKLLREWGINDAGAKSLAFDGPGKIPAEVRGVDPSKATIEAYAAQTKTAAERAERIALHIGRPAAVGFDNLITEPSKDKLKGGEEPEPVGGQAG